MKEGNRAPLLILGGVLTVEAVIGAVGFYLYDGTHGVGEAILAIDGCLTATTLAIAFIIAFPRSSSYFSDREY